MKRLNLSIVLLASVTLAIIIAVGAIVAYVSTSTNNMALEYERQAMTQSAKAAEQAVGLFADKAQSSALSLAGQRLVRDAFTEDPASVGQRLMTVLKTNPEFQAILIFDTQGAVRSGFTADGQDLSGQSRADSEFCKAILGGQDIFLARTITPAKTGGESGYLFSAAAAIRDADGRLLGGVVVFTKWSEFTSHFIDPVRFGAHGYAFMLDDQGQIVAHGADPKLILSGTHMDFVDEVLRRKSGELFYAFNGKEKYLSFTANERTGLIVCMSAYVDDLTAAASAQRNMLLGIGGAAVLVLCGAIYLMLRRLVVGPIQDVQAFTGAIRQGDFSAVLHTRFRYELAALADDIRSMVARLKDRLGFAQGVLGGFVLPCAVFDKDNKITFVNQHMLDALGRPGRPDDFLGQTSGQFVYGDPGRETLSQRALREKRLLQAEVEYTTQAGARKIFDVTSTPINDLDGNLLGVLAVWFELTEVRAQQARIEEQNQRIAQAATAADAVSDQVASASEELAAQIEQSSRGSDEQRERTSEAATAMEEMNATVMEVARNAGTAAEHAEGARLRAQQGAELVERVVKTITEAEGQARALREDMATLGDQAQGIGQILDVISDIADQTNLLALNAAIEAARAGDAGRGFAVVADEVRKLAEKTMQATNEVGRSIHSIQESAQRSIRKTEDTAEAIDAGTKLVRESGEALGEIVGMVERTTDQVRGIATASEEQSAATEEISRSTEDINRIASETADAMRQSAQAVSDLARLAQELKTIIANMNAQG